MIETWPISLDYHAHAQGTLIYIPGTANAFASPQRTLIWLDQKGKEVPIAVASNDYSGPSISPDGAEVALTISSGNKSDIWILDLLRETLTRLTFNEASSYPLGCGSFRFIVKYNFTIELVKSACAPKPHFKGDIERRAA